MPFAWLLTPVSSQPSLLPARHPPHPVNSKAHLPNLVFSPFLPAPSRATGSHLDNPRAPSDFAVVPLHPSSLVFTEQPEALFNMTN